MPDRQTVVDEREPAPRRQITYPGNREHMQANPDQHWLGPDRRGILWKPVYASYDPDTGKTLVRFRPIADHEVNRVPGLRQRVDMVKQADMIRANPEMLSGVSNSV